LVSNFGAGPGRAVKRYRRQALSNYGRNFFLVSQLAIDQTAPQRAQLELEYRMDVDSIARILVTTLGYAIL
jgi:hypothetical protein